MNIDQARGLLNEIQAILYSGSKWDVFWHNISNEIPVANVDGAFHEASAKFHALGALDIDLNNFISIFIRSQIQRFYDKLYKTRRWHLIHGHIYTYSDVLAFIEESQKLIDAIRNKVEQIHDEACKVSEEFTKHQEDHESVACGTGVWVRDI